MLPCALGRAVDWVGEAVSVTEVGLGRREEWSQAGKTKNPTAVIKPQLASKHDYTRPFANLIWSALIGRYMHICNV